MFYFEGSCCTCCGEKFKETDDIVTCPVCGSPHHRSCYKEKGGCANESLHEEGYAWSRSDDEESRSPGETDETGTVTCGLCGTENSGGRLYCCSCGRPLFDNEAGVGTGENQGFEYKIDEVPLKDISRFVGSSGMLYAPMFHQMHLTNKKVSFNFFGLLFPSFWYLNHKMYLPGILIMLYNLAGNFFTMFFYEDVQKIYSVASAFDSVGLQKLMSEAPIAFYGSMLFGLISYAIAIITALFCNRFYMNWCLKRIRKLRRKHADNEAYTAALDRCGRSNFGLVLIIVLLYFIATMLIGRLF